MKKALSYLFFDVLRLSQGNPNKKVENVMYFLFLRENVRK